MADVVHDPSGPASPKPVGVALQQASRPDSADKGKLHVFISYSRDDLDFADQLDAALTLYGFECLIDRHGISGGEDWKRRLGNLISEADTVVFVLSPDSARSDICAWEVEEAARLNKRILPVICRPLEGANPPPRLRDLNYIFFHAEPKVSGSGFGTGLASLVAALNTDFDWLREHTRYLQRATEWDARGRPANRLLSGDDIAEAKAWAARRPKSAPEPTALHLDFIRASEEEAEARSSAQREQLQAMAAAQAEREKALNEAEAALKQAADAQRKRARIRNIALVAVSILAIVVGLLGWSANQQRITAERERTTAVQERAAAEQADAILGRTTNIIVKLQAQMDVAQDHAKAREWFEKAADKGDAISMRNLGLLYSFGQGVAQDYAKAREWSEKAAANGDAIAETYLEQLSIRETAGTGRYAEALQRTEALAAKVEAVETKREGKPGKETAQALVGVAWFALFAREFTKALTVAERAHALVPDNLATEPNRAHALMFSERAEEAKALYLARKGERVSGQRLWERVIVEDFAELRKVGLTHPMMADIEKELGVSR